MNGQISFLIVPIVTLLGAFTLFPAGSMASTPDHNNDSYEESSKRARVCENSDDPGKAGTKGCFLDNGDEWYACDVHKGGSSTARVQVTEWKKKLPGRKVGRSVAKKDLQVGGPIIEKDNAGDGVKVLRDCDEGPEINVNKGNWIRIDICIEDEGMWGGSCDQRWIPE